MFLAASPMLVRVVRAGCVAYLRSSSYALHDGTRASTLERAERRLYARPFRPAHVTQRETKCSLPGGRWHEHDELPGRSRGGMQFV